MTGDPALRVKGVVVASEMQAVRRQSGWQLDNLLGRLVEVSGAGDTAALTLATGILLETQMRGESAAWISAVDSLFYPPDFAAAGIDLEALPIVRVAKGLQAARAADALIRSGGFGCLVLDLGNQASMSLTVQTRLAGLARQHNVAVLALTRRSQGGEARLPSAGRFTRPRRGPQAGRGRPPATGSEDGFAAGDRRCGSSLGSLVSLWAETRRERLAAVPEPSAVLPERPRSGAGEDGENVGGAGVRSQGVGSEKKQASSVVSSAHPARRSRWVEPHGLTAQFVCQIEVRKDKRCGGTWRHVELCRGPDGLC